MKKKLLYGLLILGCLASLLTGCGPDEEDLGVAIEETEGQAEDGTDAEGGAGTGKSSGVAFTDFDGSDLQGNAVNKDIFGNADVTVVNVWATFCSPCIEEMPQLQEWNEEKSDNVQIIGIVADVEGPDDQEGLKLAGEICGNAGITYTNIIPDDKLNENLLNNINVVPTSFLVDKNGNIISDTVVTGANVDAYKDLVNKYLGEIGK